MCFLWHFPSGRPGSPLATSLALWSPDWGPRGFQELRQRTGITPRVLSTRLRQLQADGFVQQIEGSGARTLYAVTDTGRTLEPIVAAIARWYVHEATRDADFDVKDFTETSPVSILESLPFLLRDERAADADVTFEIRLTGEGGGVWAIHIQHGACDVQPGFAENADVRYTADARIWCGVALGTLDARDARKRGLLTKEGGHDALDQYFHQIARAQAPSEWPETRGLTKE